MNDKCDCGGVYKKIPFQKYFEDSKKDLEGRLNKEDEDLAPYLALFIAPVMSGRYGHYECDKCKKIISGYSFIARNLINVQPLDNPKGIVHYMRFKD